MSQQALLIQFLKPSLHLCVITSCAKGRSCHLYLLYNGYHKSLYNSLVKINFIALIPSKVNHWSSSHLDLSNETLKNSKSSLAINHIEIRFLLSRGTYLIPFKVFFVPLMNLILTLLMLSPCILVHLLYRQLYSPLVNTP